MLFVSIFARQNGKRWFEPILAHRRRPAKIKERLLKTIPLGRFGLIKDIEAAAVFLLLRRSKLYQRCCVGG
jgi:hypothetical protein